MRLELIAETDEERAALEQGALPTPLLQMGLGAALSRAIMAAHHLRICEALKSPKSASSLAKELKLAPDGLRCLLSVLQSCDVVTQSEEGWALGHRARWLESPELSSLLEFHGDQWSLLTELESRLSVESEDIHAAKPPAFWRRYLRALDDTNRASAAELAETITLQERPRSIMDLGGGLGTWLRPLLARYPGAAAAIIERPEVVSAAALLNPRGELHYVIDDVRAVTPDADLTLMINLLPHLCDTEACALITRARASRALVLAQPCAPKPTCDQPAAVAQLLYWLMATRSPRHTTRLKTWLADAGFSHVRSIHLRTAPDTLVLLAQ